MTPVNPRTLYGPAFFGVSIPVCQFRCVNSWVRALCLLSSPSTALLRVRQNFITHKSLDCGYIWSQLHLGHTVRNWSRHVLAAASRACRLPARVMCSCWVLGVYLFVLHLPMHAAARAAFVGCAQVPSSSLGAHYGLLCRSRRKERAIKLLSQKSCRPTRLSQRTRHIIPVRKACQVQPEAIGLCPHARQARPRLEAIPQDWGRSAQDSWPQSAMVMTSLVLPAPRRAPRPQTGLALYTPRSPQRALSYLRTAARASELPARLLEPATYGSAKAATNILRQEAAARV